MLSISQNIFCKISISISVTKYISQNYDLQNGRNVGGRLCEKSQACHEGREHSVAGSNPEALEYQWIAAALRLAMTGDVFSHSLTFSLH
jgi:hypothetical protein